MARPLSFRWDEDFIARIDKARGLVPRSAFVRAAVDTYISLSVTITTDPITTMTGHELKPQPYRQTAPGPNVENVRSSDQSKRGVGPRPKGGKR